MQAELADIKQHGMEAHKKYGNFLLVVTESEEVTESMDESSKPSSQTPVPIIYHRNGRRFLLPKQAQAVYNISDAQREARGQFHQPDQSILEHFKQQKKAKEMAAKPSVSNAEP